MIQYRRLICALGFCCLFFLLLLPREVNASFIESTIGTAVVNDATAAYYNPAALTLVQQPQIIGLGSFAYFNSEFSGQARQPQTGFTLSGTTHNHTDFYLPSGYFALPATKRISLGVAIVGNDFNRDVEQNSILRYAQSSNSTQNIDVVPAVGIKLNEMLSVGANVNFSHADLLLKPTSGIPALNIPDSQSRNQSSGDAVGGDLGLLLKPTTSTLIGFNYRSAMTYRLSGRSVLEGNPGITSNNYYFNFWTPARYVLSVNQMVNPKLGFIGTAQWVQWDIINNLNIHNIATRIGLQPVIVPNATVPYHLHNAWIFTLGSHYRLTSQWIIRVAGTYLQSPGNPNFQISNGDNVILGGSVGYQIFKNILLDASYAHAFVDSQNIRIFNPRNVITGINRGSRDSISVKLTVSL